MFSCPEIKAINTYFLSIPCCDEFNWVKAAQTPSLGKCAASLVAYRSKMVIDKPTTQPKKTKSKIPLFQDTISPQPSIVSPWNLVCHSHCFKFYWMIFKRLSGHALSKNTSCTSNTSFLIWWRAMFAHLVLHHHELYNHSSKSKE
jgi:hypothetical protein